LRKPSTAHIHSKICSGTLPLPIFPVQMARGSNFRILKKNTKFKF